MQAGSSGYRQQQESHRGVQLEQREFQFEQRDRGPPRGSGQHHDPGRVLRCVLQLRAAGVLYRDSDS